MNAGSYPQTISAESVDWSSVTSLAFISKKKNERMGQHGGIAGLRWAAGTPSVWEGRQTQEHTCAARRTDELRTKDRPN